MKSVVVVLLLLWELAVEDGALWVSLQGLEAVVCGLEPPEWKAMAVLATVQCPCRGGTVLETQQRACQSTRPVQEMECEEQVFPRKLLLE